MADQLPLSSSVIVRSTFLLFLPLINLNSEIVSSDEWHTHKEKQENQIRELYNHPAVVAAVFAFSSFLFPLPVVFHAVPLNVFSYVQSL